MTRFAARARPLVAIVLVLALLVPVGRWAAEEFAFGTSREAVEEELGEDAELAEALLLVRSVSCGGRVSTGSAFVLGLPAGPTIITNRHVVDDARSVSVRPLTGGRVTPVDRHLIADGADVAVLELEDDAAIPPALAPGAAAQVGEEVRVVGFPAGRPSTGTGTITDVAGGRMIVDVPVSSGVSGSPLLGDDGRVVGQVFATTVDGDGVATPIATVREVIATAAEAPGC